MIARTAGMLCWNRLTLERSLPDGGAGDRLWLARDVHTRETQVVEFLSAGRAISCCPPHPLHPSLLAFYRFEGAKQDAAAIFAYHPLLETPPLSDLSAGQVEPVTALRWAIAIGQAAAILHDAGLRAHGAIVPGQIRAAAETPPLLTGYPVTGETLTGIPPEQLSGQRRNGSDPVPSDDIYGVAAVLYFLLTGHVFISDGDAPPEFVIDDIRRAAGLAPTGWISGWEKPLRAALAGLVSFRPSSMQALVDELGAVLHDSPELPPAETRSPPKRRVPSWRCARGGRPVSTAEPASDATASGGAISEEHVHIKRLRAELERSRETMAADVEAAKRARADTERRGAELQEKHTALEAERSKLDAEKRALVQARTTVEDLQQRLERQQQKQTAVEADLAQRAAEMKAERARLEQLSRQLEEKRSAADARVEKTARATEQRLLQVEQELAKAEQRLAQTEQGLERRSQVITDVQHERSSSHGHPRKHPRTARIPAGEVHEADPPSDKGSPSADPSHRPLPVCRTTLGLRSGRRLHLFCGQIMRFGRHAESDFMLLATLRGQSANLGVSREISRKHFELQISPDGLRVIDGWSDEGKASQHGVCINGRRVPPEGAELRHGAILSVTTRAPGPSVPHWRITFVPAPIAAVRVGDNEQAPSPFFSAAVLRRMDDPPDDICIFLETVPLRYLDPDEPANSQVALNRSPEGVTWGDGSQSLRLTEGSSPAPGIDVVSVGRLVPSSPMADAG